MTVLSLLVGIATTVFMVAACVGAGLALLRSFGLILKLDRTEAVAWAFPLGMGLLGWATSFLGFFEVANAPAFLFLLALALPCLVIIRDTKPSDERSSPGGCILYPLYIALIIVLGIDFAEALSPPVDADSLAYHFALPKQFVSAGRLEFAPRGADGAIPLLTQMTWMVALALGGEFGMTLWTGTSGAMTGLLVFAIARPYLGKAWTLALVVVFLSTPAMLYGAGSGQTEARLALFATLAAFAMVRGIPTRDVGFIAIAGIAAGFCIGTKYTGLLLAAAVAVPMLLFWRSPKAWVYYAAAAAAAGFQWYAWNLWHTGDPFFPVLYSFLRLPDSSVWTAAQDAVFRAVHATSERPLPVNLLWLLIYPFHATLAPIADIESGRTGLGPYGLLILPFFLIGAWQWRQMPKATQDLSILVLIASIFYIVWFVSGISQRVRHLLIVLPMFLIFATAFAAHGARISSLQRSLAACVAITIAIQLAGQIIFGISFVQYLTTNESREDFLRRSVSYYDFVPSVEREMTDKDRVLIEFRQLNYLFNKPIFYYHDVLQSEISARDGLTDPAKFLYQLKAKHVTLLLVAWPIGSRSEPSRPSDLATAAHRLASFGCLRMVRELTATPIGSRTLTTLSVPPGTAGLYRLIDDGCRLTDAT